jgi:hypothetical protein
MGWRSKSLLDSLVQSLIIIVVALPYAYATYWGLAIRKGLAMRWSRNQALAISVVAGDFVLGWILGNFFGQGIPVFALAVWSASSNISAFYFVNSTAGMAKRSDPFERDNLLWSKVRYLLAFGVIAAVAVTFVNSPVNLVFGAGVGIPTPTPLVYQITGFGAYIAMFVVGSAVLIVSAVRSRDKTLKRHLMWFGFFLVAILLGLLQYSLLIILSRSYGVAALSSAGQFILSGLLAFGGYCLYSSVKNLFPTTSRLESVKRGLKNKGDE